MAAHLSRLSKDGRLGVAVVIAIGVFAAACGDIYSPTVGTASLGPLFQFPVGSAAMLLGLLSAARHEDRRWPQHGATRTWGARFGLFAVLWTVLAAFQITFSVSTYGGLETVWFVFLALEVALWGRLVLR